MAVATDPRLEEVRKIAQGRGVEFFFAQFVDMYGRPSAKLVPAEHLSDLVHEGAGFAGFAAGEIGQMPSDPDIAAIPDLDSLTLVPWQENLARFACDVTVEGEPWPYCPRTILKRNTLRKDNAFFSWDVRISRSVGVGRQGEVEAIVEIFNITNTDNFRDPAATSLLFNFDGTIRSGLGDPRQVQAGLRWVF